MAAIALENVPGHSRSGKRSLALHYRHLAPGYAARAATATFIPPEDVDMEGYPLLASPTLYAGQTVRARVEADQANQQPVDCRLYSQHYGAEDRLIRTYSPEAPLPAGGEHTFQWKLSSTGGGPIVAVGLEIRGQGGASGTVYLDELTWDGPPDVVLARPAGGGTLWRRAWVQGVDQWETSWPPEAYHLAQNSGTGLLIQGTREWTDYAVEATVGTDLAQAVGIGARVQGMARYYALLLCRDNTVRLVKALDGKKVLAEAAFPGSQAEVICCASKSLAQSCAAG